MRVDSHEWHGMWEKMGQFLGKFSTPIVWKFIPEQLQDPDKVTEYLQGKCCGNSREEQLIAVFWTLATIYWTLLGTRQHPQGKEKESRPTGSMSTQTEAEPEEQPMLVDVTPIQKKKSKTKSVLLVWDEEEVGPSKEEEEEGPEIITQSLSLGELQDMRDMQKYFSQQLG
ncbi:hypothetical protein BTVI_26046 [Pitangus sulphuratus]|nr:hypothetical protein BTVI_26046 [Pitangus sulphuratus]